MMKKLAYVEKALIAYNLSAYHKVFYTFWDVSGVYIIDETDIPGMTTACVMFPPENEYKPTIYLNEKFWNKLTLKEKLFVLCHECLHVILDHGMRLGKEEVKGATFQEINIAQDITINEMIVSLFGFDRKDISMERSLCWINTVFRGQVYIAPNMPFVYYLAKLVENRERLMSKLPELLDKHFENQDPSKGGAGQPGASPQPQDLKPGAGAGEKSDEEKAKDKLAGALAKELDKEEKTKIAEQVKGSKAGDGLGNSILATPPIKPKKVNFKAFVHKLAKTSMHTEVEAKESFAYPNRRFDDFLSRNRGISLPGLHEKVSIKRNRLKTAVFMDVSGSCIGLVGEFRDAAAAFAKYPQVFDIETFRFDTGLEKIDITKQIRGGGGTSFHQIEEYLKKQAKYPDCVIVITDGDGSQVAPKFPERWVWLLSAANYRYCHEKSQKFLLRDVIF